MRTEFVEDESGHPSIAWVIAAMVALTCAVLVGLVTYAYLERHALLSDLVAAPPVPGEHVLSSSSSEGGKVIIDAMNMYGHEHPNRDVYSAQRIVVVDENGRAQFYHKIFYKPR